MEEHTPTPWVVGDWRGQCHIKHRHGFEECVYDYTLETTGDSACCISLDGARILIGWDEYGTVLKNPADAAFIVKAVNAHDRLVAALKRISTINHNLGTLSDTHLLGKAIEIADEVLAEVEK